MTHFLWVLQAGVAPTQYNLFTLNASQALEFTEALLPLSLAPNDAASANYSAAVAAGEATRGPYCHFSSPDRLSESSLMYTDVSRKWQNVRNGSIAPSQARRRA